MTEQAAKEDTALLRRDEQREQQTRAANPAKMQQEASVFACRRAHTREHEKKDPRQATNEQVQTDLDKGRLRTNGQSQTNRTSRDKRQRITNEDIGLSN